MDRYIEIIPLGEGASGKVILAKDSESRNLVVVKSVKKIYRNAKTIIRERLVPEELQKGDCHRNISCMLNYYEDDNNVYIISEYIEGIDMRDWVKQGKNNDPIELLNISYELADAFEYMHSENIVHRDIKLDNIIVTNYNHPIVIDFGGSCIKGLNPENDDYSRILCDNSNTITGTFETMAPELLELGANIKSLDLFATDVYSFGVVLFELFNSDYPIKFYPKNISKTYDAKTSDKYKISDSGIREVDILLKDMLKVSPGDRPTMADIKGRLAKMIKTINYEDIVEDFQFIKNMINSGKAKNHKFIKSKIVNGKEQYLLKIEDFRNNKYYSWVYRDKVSNNIYEIK